MTISPTSGSTASLSVTDALVDGENTITIRAIDHTRTGDQPVGKQCQLYHSAGCSYTRTTGIWQTVWLENVAKDYIASTKYYPDIDNKKLVIEAHVVGGEGMTLFADASFVGAPQGHGEAVVHGGKATLEVPLNELYLWETGKGRLYDLTLTLGEDRVASYFGMRRVEARDGILYINHKPVFQRLILDQGFYPDGIYTASCEGELIADIDRSMAMGLQRRPSPPEGL